MHSNGRSFKVCPGIRQICDEHGIIMVCDEVMSGFGRSGTMFGFQQDSTVLPDVVTFAKVGGHAYAAANPKAATQRGFPPTRRCCHAGPRRKFLP